MDRLYGINIGPSHNTLTEGRRVNVIFRNIRRQVSDDDIEGHIGAVVVLATTGIFYLVFEPASIWTTIIVFPISGRAAQWLVSRHSQYARIMINLSKHDRPFLYLSVDVGTTVAAVIGFLLLLILLGALTWRLTS